jgi:hypothetical protein
LATRLNQKEAYLASYLVDIDLNAAASLSWQHPPYGKTAIDEHCDEFNLAEAVKFVIDSLPADQRPHAKINAAGKEYGIVEIEHIYRGLLGK